MLSNLTVTVPESSSGALAGVAPWVLLGGLVVAVLSLAIAYETGKYRRVCTVGIVLGLLTALSGVALVAYLHEGNNAADAARVAALQDAAHEQLGAGFLNLHYSDVAVAFDDSPTMGAVDLYDGVLVGDRTYDDCQMVTVDRDDATYRFLVTCGPDGEALRPAASSD